MGEEIARQIAIVGAGSLGQAFAGLLAASRRPVTPLASPQTAARLGQSGRIRLRGAVTADVPVAVMPAPAGTAVVTDDPARLPAASGLIFVTKGHQLERAAEAVRAVWPHQEDTISWGRRDAEWLAQGRCAGRGIRDSAGG